MLYLTKEIAIGAPFRAEPVWGWRESPVLNDKGITVVLKAIKGLRQDFVFSHFLRCIS